MEIHFGKKDGVAYLGPVFGQYSAWDFKPKSVIEQLESGLQKAVEEIYSGQEVAGVHNVNLVVSNVGSKPIHYFTADAYTIG